MQMKEANNTGKPKRTARAADYAYYTGAAFQMIAIIGVFTYIGYRIDQSGGTGQVLYTALFSVAGVLISLYTIIKSVIKKNDGGRRRRDQT